MDIFKYSLITKGFAEYKSKASKNFISVYQLKKYDSLTILISPIT